MRKNFSGRKFSQGNNAINESSEQNSAENSLLPGIKPVLELLRRSPERIDCVFLRKGRKDSQTDEIIDICRAKGVRFSLVDSDGFKRVYSGSSQGVVARIFEAGFKDLEEVVAAALAAPLQLLVALDQVQDPGNAGTLIRTLYALGGGGLITARHQSAYLGAAASKSAAGAMQLLPIAKVTNLAQALDKLEEKGFHIYGAATGVNTQSVYDFQPEFPAVLVLGGEDEGIRAGIAKRCQTMLEIPMKRDFDSINVAQAGAIITGFFAAKSGAVS